MKIVEKEKKSQSEWWVYMVETTCHCLYTGITTDVERRFLEHRSVFHDGATKGAKYFRSREPKGIVFKEPCESRSEASKREYEIKKMSKKQKLGLIKD